MMSRTCRRSRRDHAPATEQSPRSSVRGTEDATENDHLPRRLS